ncbi:hypothetical protein [Streptomyces fuscigenes]|uniref:hypothetical protein n=1 Tax=Streptomyces fuscigenes TaxID=1528880 RepID=UPI001F388FA1|nr:hypothetical protein [Streptomyces fuscigenes]MCF3960249.1 hypothetical protein [Streptomyces fuscigenes]
MAEPANRAAGDEPRSPWLRTGFVLAAAFLGFVAVGGGFVALTAGDPGGNGPAAVQAAAHGAAPAPAVRTGDRDPCPRLKDRSQSVPTSAPAGVTWSLYGSVALPSSTGSGPAEVDGDVARCYAHTPVGALLATGQISVRYLAAHDWRTVARTQLVGAGRDAYVAGRTAAEKTAPPDQDPAAFGQIAGFDFVSYAADAAEIETVWRFPDGRMQGATTTVRWQDGDWRLDFPADPPAPVPVDSLAGHTPWAGV